MTSFEDLYNKLNLSQKEAVNHIDWPAMVIAGPWTWKTQVLGARTANLILNAKVNPENILITTFTESWVVAIKERLLNFIWTDAHKVYVATIHSLAQDIIKNFAHKFVFSKSSTLIDDVDSYELLSEIIEKLVNEKKLEHLFTYGDKLFYLSDIKRAIWNLKNEWVSLEKLNSLIFAEEKYYAEQLEEKKQNKRIKNIEKYSSDYEKIVWKMKELYLIFEEYNKILKEKWYYDFSDLINFVLEKMKDDDELKYYYAEKFQYIMLDEYQDTNNAQNEIIDLIMSVSPDKDYPNIMVVWDDDQSIYRFQWANIENMLDFSNKYKNTKFIVLSENYRSTQEILDASSELIENNSERLVNKINWLKKDLISVKSRNWKSKIENDISSVIPAEAGIYKNINKTLLKDESNYNNQLIDSGLNPEWRMNFKNKPIFYSASNEIDEKNFVLEKIQSLNSNLQSLNSIAIIVRNNREVESWSGFLHENGIQVESKLKTNILKSDYIKFILQFLEVIANPYSNEESFINVLRCDFIDVDKIDILSINQYLYNKNYVRKDKIKIFDLLKNLENFVELEFRNKQKLLDFRDNLAYLNSRLSSTNFIIFFNEFIDKSWILNYIEKNWTFDDLQDIFSLFNKIKKWVELNKKFSVKSLLTKIWLHNKFNIAIERQIQFDKKNWVQVMTAHASKWLEFDTVFIPGLFDWNWNNKRVIEKLKLPRWVVWEWLQFAEEADDKKERQLEEDRRLFFVALTRARDNLFLSFWRNTDWKINIISQFVQELWDSVCFIESTKQDEDTFTKLMKNSLIWTTNRLIKHTDLELDYIENFLKNYKLSPSDLNKFLEDPGVFLKEAVFKYPFVDNEATIFWKVYHRTLELFFIKYKNENVLPKLDYLLATFSLLIKQEILNSEELERLEERWLKWLTWYYETYKNNFREHLELEYNFRWKNIVFSWIPITWKIDKIELVNSEQWIVNSYGKNLNVEIWWQLAFFKQAVSIIDYKTWSIKRLWEIKWVDKDGNKKQDFKEWKYWRQLLFYKLLCELDREFSSKYDIVSMWLDFVEWKNDDYKIVEVAFSDEEYDEFKELLKATWEKISSLDFWREYLQIK